MGIFLGSRKTKGGISLYLNAKNIIQKLDTTPNHQSCWNQCCNCCCKKYAPCSCNCYWEVAQELPPRSNETWWRQPEGEAYIPGETGTLPGSRGGQWGVLGVPNVTDWYAEYRNGCNGPVYNRCYQVGPSSFSVYLVSPFAWNPFSNDGSCLDDPNDPPWPGPPYTGDYLGTWIVQSTCTFYFLNKCCTMEPNPYGYGEIEVCGAPFPLGITENVSLDYIDGAGATGIGSGCGSGITGPPRYQWHPFFPGCCSYWCGGSSGPLCADGLKEQTCIHPGTSTHFYYKFNINGIQEHEQQCCGGFYGTCGPYEPTILTSYNDRPGNVNY